MAISITASMLYDLVLCPCRVAMDLFGDYDERDAISPFTRLLWERGHAFETEVIQGLDEEYLDLSGLPDEDRERETTAAMERAESLIYGGRLRSDDLLGEPDVLRRDGKGYLAGDIKSGAGEEAVGNGEERRPKKHYAVQLALYTDILERVGLSSGRRAFVWDVHGEEIMYNLDAARGKRTAGSWWDVYTEALAEARRITSREVEPLPALCSDCKQCHWRSVCRERLEETDDLTLIPELGRAKRDGLAPHVKTVAELATFDVSALVTGKKTVIRGIGPATLEKAQRRARLLKAADPKPYLTDKLTLPDSSHEVFFDIEVDPFRDICYLHGFIERRGGNNDTEEYTRFFAMEPTDEAEREAFAQAVEYVRKSQPAIVYYYSKYERTIWRKLRQKYPDVATDEEIEDIFGPLRSVDLYFDVVKPHTEWPTNDHSIKSLATYLGFDWRDTEPSGAASIEWYDRWVTSGDDAVRQRILDYNEDDCRATRVLLDAVRQLSVLEL